MINPEGGNERHECQRNWANDERAHPGDHDEQREGEVLRALARTHPGKAHEPGRVDRGKKRDDDQARNAFHPERASTSAIGKTRKNNQITAIIHPKRSQGAVLTGIASRGALGAESGRVVFTFSIVRHILALTPPTTAVHDRAARGARRRSRKLLPRRRG